MRWWEMCKQRLVPCVPAPLLQCVATWQAGRRQGSGETAPRLPQHLHHGLSGIHLWVPGKQQTEDAVDNLEEASHEQQQPGSGALLFHRRDVLPLPVGMAHRREYCGEEDAVDASGSADHWADLEHPAAEHAPTWSHQ